VSVVGLTHRHADGADHGHAHEHGPAARETPPPAPSRGVAIDVGDGFGALVLYAGAERGGLEVEIFPDAEPNRRQHVWVLERELGKAANAANAGKAAKAGKATVFAAVFPSLPEGRYCICDAKGGVPTQQVDVAGGTVTEARWEVVPRTSAGVPHGVAAPRGR